MLNDVEKAIVRKVIDGLGFQDLAEYTTERMEGYRLKEIRPAWERLVADGVITSKDGHFYTTTWTLEDVKRGYKEA